MDWKCTEVCIEDCSIFCHMFIRVYVQVLSFSVAKVARFIVQPMQKQKAKQCKGMVKGSRGSKGKGRGMAKRQRQGADQVMRVQELHDNHAVVFCCLWDTWHFMQPYKKKLHSCIDCSNISVCVREREMVCLLMLNVCVSIVVHIHLARYCRVV